MWEQYTHVKLTNTNDFYTIRVIKISNNRLRNPDICNVACTPCKIPMANQEIRETNLTELTREVIRI